MDHFTRSLFLGAGLREKAQEIVEERIAIAALGSYGRRELCIGSDVDLLVIHQGRLSPEMHGVIQRALYPLWDAKLDVGQAVLSVQEALRLAMGDFRFLTSVMDARFLLGSRAFFRLFDAALWSKVEREKETLLSQFLVYRQKREEKYGREEFFVEPDIKEGLGGLRDIHFMAWMARIYFKSRNLRGLERFPVFSHFSLDKLHSSESFLLKLRNHLHLMAGCRREDRLLLPLQEKISRSLGYRDGANHTGPEKFMRNLHRHLNRIRYGSEEFHIKAMDIIDPRPFEPPPERLPPEFQVMKGNIELKAEGLFGKDPLLVLKGFEEASRRGLSLGSGFIWEATRKISTDGAGLAEGKGAREIFLQIVLQPSNPKLLRLALEMGLIGLFIPEFKKIRNLAQFGYYHVETVDLHSLRTLEVMQQIAEGFYDERWPLLKEVFREVENRPWLFLAGLLHDVGKGFRGDHAKRGSQLIPRILKRLGIGGEALRVIPFLVRHHLLLVNISQGRDLNEEKTSVTVAQVVKNPENLRLLFLLTIADSLATGPMASSDWRMMLLIELYFKVRRILDRGTLVSPDATKRADENKRALLRGLAPRLDKREVLDLMEQVSPRYFLNTPFEYMIEHFDLAMTMGDSRLKWVLHKLKDAPVTKMILCARDMPGLFSKMVGVFALNNINVLSANIHTLKNGLAFDIYDVTNPLDPYREEEMWRKVLQNALEAIEGTLPLDEWINRKERTTLQSRGDYPSPAKRVNVDNAASDFFTILEVTGGVRTGLLYDLAKKIFSLGLDIRFAKVNSDKEGMTGVFYVRDASGQKIYEDAVLDKTRDEIVSILG